MLAQKKFFINIGTLVVKINYINLKHDYIKLIYKTYLPKIPYYIYFKHILFILNKVNIPILYIYVDVNVKCNKIIDIISYIVKARFFFNKKSRNP